MEKTMEEMSNRELFAVLAGNEGVMAQYQLQKVVKAYLKYSKEHPEYPQADLQTMVSDYLKGTYA